MLIEPPCSGKQYTYSQANDAANAIATWAAKIGARLLYWLSITLLGIQCGTPVALFMENRPEFIYTWLGLSKIGIPPRCAPAP